MAERAQESGEAMFLSVGLSPTIGGGETIFGRPLPVLIRTASVESVDKSRSDTIIT